eukprot:Gregarina_sp_Pseudo_9__795@NODE_1507_length_1537_cov_3_780374_g1396_i0_p4_GENE_NODE_1507_length_1537_cov_3_780374_g1396_i0NODE_1507_length_1537_cov_3_780374_g1396_i0_p4_ORF_typecomplete_len159_score27_03RS4NT/PF08071_12/4_3e03RS4NT/PF08071_12/1_2e02RS4NT/PF08071_12/1_3_NODE_1507_length_1537_cov_3_780374_g1396_i09681444
MYVDPSDPREVEALLGFQRLLRKNEGVWNIELNVRYPHQIQMMHDFLPQLRRPGMRWQLRTHPSKLHEAPDFLDLLPTMQKRGGVWTIRATHPGEDQAPVWIVEPVRPRRMNIQAPVEPPPARKGLKRILPAAPGALALKKCKGVWMVCVSTDTAHST